MDTGATATILEQAAAYTEKFVQAAIPVAKKAYEIGLLTLQIDALQTIVPCVLVLILSSVIIWKCIRTYQNAMKLAIEKKIKKTTYTYIDNDYDWVKAGNIPLDGAIVCIPGFCALIGMIVSFVLMCDVWLWIKLFKPELWLAKQAITAVLNATGAK